MWYLLAEKGAATMRSQIEEGKKNHGGRMSPQQLVDAENKSAQWLKTTRKVPASSGSEQVRNQQAPRKLRAAVEATTEG